MDGATYTTLGRQSGLMREMQVVANNIANLSTTGYRREGVVFDLTQASLSQTGGAFDLGIQGDGFFLVETPEGQRLTRAGAFTPNAEGELVTPDGHRLLDAGAAPLFVPPGAGPVAIGADGTLSAGGQPLGRVGLWQPVDPGDLIHAAGTLFAADGGVEPVDGGTIRQGFLEEANVNPVSEITRMITVQRAYELGQTFLDREDTRVRGVIQTLGQ
jgi:flagellar basal-body rod protein FlgF